MSIIFNGATLYTFNEVRNALHVSARTLYSMRERGDIEGVKFGNRWYFPDTAIRAYMEKLQESQSDQEPKN